MKFPNHPLTLARERAGIGQRALAEAINCHRSTLAAIEEARTVTPDPDTLRDIEVALKLPLDSLQESIARWRAEQRERGPLLTPTARAVLQATPHWVSQQGSFDRWRVNLAPSVTAFASMLGVNRAVVAQYEQGIRTNGMPQTLSHALLTVLGISNDYLVALKGLPPTSED